MPAPGNFIGLGDMPACKITAAYIEYLAFTDKLFHCLPDFFPGCRTVNVMHLIKVDVVGLQALKARFASTFDVQRRQFTFVRPIAHVSVDFGSKYSLFAAI